MVDQKDKKSIILMAFAAVAIITLAVLTLTGIAVVLEYGNALKLPATITDETVAISSGAGTLANDELTVFTSLKNATDGTAYASPIVNVTLATGIIQTSLPDDNYNATYTYKADTDGTESANDFVTGLAIFGAFAGVLVIALIGMVIVNMYKRKND